MRQESPPSSSPQGRPTAESVVDAAERLLDSHGVEGLSVRRLADSLGVSRQVVYTHFDGMNGVLEALHRRAGAELADGVRSLDAVQDQDERLRQAARAYLGIARNRPAMFGLAFGQPVPGYRPSPEATAELRGVFRTHVVGLIQDWNRANGVTDPPGDEIAAARIFWSTVHGLITLEQAGHAEPAETDDLSDRAVALLVSGWRDNPVGNDGSTSTEGRRSDLAATTVSDMAEHAPRRLSTVERIASSRLGAWYFINVTSKLDPPLLKLTDGRLSSLPGQPILLLGHVGARSGKPRETPLVYATDGDDIVLVASYGGSPTNPAWYHNLKANPTCDIVAAGRSGRYRAEEVAGDDYDRLWESALDVYGGYQVYQSRTGGRRIPLIRLTPLPDA